MTPLEPSGLSETERERAAGQQAQLGSYRAGPGFTGPCLKTLLVPSGLSATNMEQDTLNASAKGRDEAETSPQGQLSTTESEE